MAAVAGVSRLDLELLKRAAANIQAQAEMFREHADCCHGLAMRNALDAQVKLDRLARQLVALAEGRE